LEAMEEKQVSIEGRKIEMPKPFIVLATQNPVEAESTFRLPAAQMDRFLIRLSIGYPDPKEEMNMLEKLGDEIPFDLVNAVCSGDDILQAQKEVSNVKLSARVEEYIVAIATATRNDSRLDIGASPRATRGLYKASKAYAALDGRDFVTPDDVKAICVPVLAHRLVLKGASRYSGVSAEEVLEDILNSTPVPTDILK
ncbi:MAG: MoxR family ATPase, partial [Clostridia bacterium]|nr:MoxR family ATPase [Clostridia bacterium]